MTFVNSNIGWFLALLVLLAVSAFFSGAETVLFSLTAHERRRLRQSTQRREVLAARLLDDSRSLITTLMLGNMGANVLIFVISAQLLAGLQRHVGTGIAAASALVPSLVVTYASDVLPKIIGRLDNLRLAPLVAVPIAGLLRVARPICRIIDIGVLRPVHRVISPASSAGGDADGTVTMFSPQDMAEMLEMSREQGLIDGSENDLLQEVVRIGDLRVRDVMTPRVDVIAHNIKDSPEKLRELFRNSHLAKLPVYEGQIDNLLGLVYAKEFLLSLEPPAPAGGRNRPVSPASPPPAPPDLRKLLRPVKFVPELQSLDRLITRFRQTRTQWAAVVDEYGGFVGLVTLEDVVEQMVGDIYEPHDSPRQSVERLAPDEYRVAGDLPIADWEEAFDVSAARLAAAHSRSSTIAGLLASLLKRIPKPGDQVRLGHLLMTVESMRSRRVERVRLKLVDHHAMGSVPGGLPVEYFRESAAASEAPAAATPPTAVPETPSGGGRKAEARL
jgi:CBS domain containing-hemolysin-like protein